MKYTQLNPSGLPLVVEPEEASEANVAALRAWIKENSKQLDEKLIQHGSILFRGFNPKETIDFENVALGLEPNLREDYLGTSARTKLTRYVYTASEMPPHFPIPQHCEMSFSKRVPSRIFFYCITPSQVNGETPLCDFQRVYETLEPSIRDKWESRQIRYIRNYNSANSTSWDPVSVKNWQEVFDTKDKKEIEKICKEEDYKFQWLPGDKLRLENIGPAVRKHPTTGKKIWFNHGHIFHPTTQYDEYARMFNWLPRHRLWSFLFIVIGYLLFLFKSLIQSPESGAMFCTFADKTPIPAGEVTKVRDAIWKNMIISQWKKGDMLYVDNTRVSHGRLPFAGPRKVAVCMSDW